MNPNTSYVLEFLKNNTLLINWESLIGAGKSTLCKSIAKHLGKYGINNTWYPEPINKKLLELFYSDPKKYAFSFQTIVIRERVHVSIDAYKYLLFDGNYASIDRSRCGDLSFGITHYLNKNISGEEFKVYTDLLNSTTLNNYSTVNINECVVYLECSPNKAKDRITRRGNNDEIEKCSIEYLTDLDFNYRKVLSNLSGLTKNDQSGGNKMSLLEQEAINELSKSNKNINIIFIDYNQDLKIESDETICEDETFKILYDIITKIKLNKNKSKVE